MSRVPITQLQLEMSTKIGKKKEGHGGSRTKRRSVRGKPSDTRSTSAKDYFIERGGIKFAGTHLLIDFWEAVNLNRIGVVERALKDAAKAAGATLLHSYLHYFTPNGGITGVLALAESHITIHTWPEKGYAALDVFMCGSCDPYKTLPVLRMAFRPSRISFEEQKRGSLT